MLISGSGFDGLNGPDGRVEIGSFEVKLPPEGIKQAK